LVNSSDRKIIKLTYEQAEGNGWYLASQEMSDGLSGLIQVPRFDPRSTDPMGQHIRAVYLALAKVKLGGGRVIQTMDVRRQELVFEIKREIEKAQSHNGEDSAAHEAIMKEGYERLEEEMQRVDRGKPLSELFVGTFTRMHDPAKLIATKPR